MRKIPKGFGVCQVCDGIFMLTLEGVVQAHSGKGSRDCRGTFKEPKEENNAVQSK